MDKFLLTHIEKCTGCGLCTLVCSGVKEGRFEPTKARVHFVNFPREGRSVPNICFHCEMADCAKACPVNAIRRSETGAVLVNNDTCTGCAECVEACPYGMIELNDKQIAYKCDLCDGDPECVKVCQPKAITYYVPNEATLKERLLQMSKKITEGEPANKRITIAKIVKDLLQ